MKSPEFFNKHKNEINPDFVTLEGHIEGAKALNKELSTFRDDTEKRQMGAKKKFSQSEKNSTEIPETKEDIFLADEIGVGEDLPFREKMHQKTKTPEGTAKHFERVEYEKETNQHEYESALKFKKLKDLGIDVEKLSKEEFRELLGGDLVQVKDREPGVREKGIKKYPKNNWFRSLTSRKTKHPRGVKDLIYFKPELEEPEKAKEIYDTTGSGWQEAEEKIPKGFTKEEWHKWLDRLYRKWRNDGN